MSRVLLFACLAPLLGCQIAIDDYRARECDDAHPCVGKRICDDGFCKLPEEVPLVGKGEYSSLTLEAREVGEGQGMDVWVTARDEYGAALNKPTAVVTLQLEGGTSKGTFTAPVFEGQGLYRATFQGGSAGTAATVRAWVNGEPLPEPSPTVTVVREELPTQGLVFALDAAKADGASLFGGSGCPASGAARWLDVRGMLAGTLSGFGDLCDAWNGNGSLKNPHRLKLDGVDDRVQFGTQHSLGQFTVSAWIRRRTVGVAPAGGTLVPILSRGFANEAEADALDLNYLLGVNAAGVVGVEFEESGTHANLVLLGRTPLIPERWYHVAATFNQTERAVFVNGVLERTETLAKTPSAGSNALLTVGASRGTQGSVSGFFSGDIARVHLYNRALNNEEMWALCKAQRVRFDGGKCGE